jgi:chromate transporter
VPFPYVVIAAALAGALGGHFAPRVFSGGGAHGAGAQHYGPAIIDDDTPTPEHARYRPARLLAIAAAFLGLWAATLGALALAFGWQGTLTQMGWFFTKAALLTFGGAYAVLPYVYQAAVEQHQWLSAAQMIDGLALGETTPGPLIIVVAFVGFLGAGVAGALVATFFTFLPSFLFIFAGAPLVEATHGDLKFTAPLTGITAAVVGVVVSLAVFFAQHVFLVAGAADWAAILLATAALVALVRFKTGLIPVILACGAAGLCYRLLFP